MTNSAPTAGSYLPYNPSHAAAALFAAIIGVSLVVHVYQNFRYKFWRVTFFMFLGRHGLYSWMDYASTPILRYFQPEPLYRSTMPHTGWSPNLRGCRV